MRNLLIGLSVIGLVGCAGAFGPNYQALNEQEYHYYSKLSANIEKCYEAGFVEPKLLADVDHNMGVVLSIRSFDKEKMRSLYQEYKKGIPAATADSCKDTSVDIYTNIQHGERIQRNQAAQAGRPVQNTWPTTSKPVMCNTVGTVTMCN